MLRTASNLVVTASLVFAVFAIALGVRSYFRTDWLTITRHIKTMEWDDRWADFDLTSSRGQFILHDHKYGDLPIYHDRWSFQSNPDYDRGNGAFQWGFDHYVDGAWAFKVPHWGMFLVASILPGFRFVRARRRARIKLGHCRACGYDLRATPQRCPECGTVRGN